MRRYVFSATTVLLTLAVIGCASMRSEVDFGREHEAKGDYTTAILSYASAHVNGEITEDAWEAELARMESELTEADFKYAKSEANAFAKSQAAQAKAQNDTGAVRYWLQLMLLIPL